MMASCPLSPALSPFRFQGALDREALEVTARSYSCHKGGSKLRIPPNTPGFDLGCSCCCWRLTPQRRFPPTRPTTPAHDFLPSSGHMSNLLTSRRDSFAHPPSIPSHLITQPRIRPSVLVIARTGLGYLLLSSGYTEVGFSVFERKFQFLKAGASNLTHTQLTSLAVPRCPVVLRLRANSFRLSPRRPIQVHLFHRETYPSHKDVDRS